MVLASIDIITLPILNDPDTVSNVKFTTIDIICFSIS